MIRRIIFLVIVVWVALNMSACGGGCGCSKAEPQVGGPEASKAASSVEPAVKDSPDTASTAETVPVPEAAPEAASETKAEPEAVLKDVWINGPSKLTPKLEAIVSALKAKNGQSFNIQKELAKYEKDFVAQDFKDLSLEGIVQVVEVKKEHLLMAFVSVVPEGAVPCDEDFEFCEETAEWIFALHLVRDESGRDRIAFRDWDSEMKLFGSESPQVVFPIAAAHLPVVQLLYQYNSNRVGKVKVMEAYHFAQQETITGKVFLDLSVDRSGDSEYTGAKIAWIASKKPDRAFLVQVSLSSYHTYPCTGDDADYNSPDCREQVQCERTTTLQVVTSDTVSQPSKKEIEELRKTEPGLANLPPHMEGSTKKECKKMGDIKL